MESKDAFNLEDNLPSIGSRDQNDVKGYSYYKALHQLKEVSQRILILKNRLALLHQKQEQTKHPVSDYYQQKEARLTVLNRSYKQKSEQQMLKMREKVQSDINLKRINNQRIKRENLKRVDKAKRNVTQQKYRRHDLVKEKSQQNRATIERLKACSLVEKQQRHNTMLELSRRSKNTIKELFESRKEEIRSTNKHQTLLILKKIEEKERTLSQMTIECERQEAELKRLNQKRNRKMRRMLNGNQLKRVETVNNTWFQKEVSTTPRSALSFVVIS